MNSIHVARPLFESATPIVPLYISMMPWVAMITGLVTMVAQIVLVVYVARLVGAAEELVRHMDGGARKTTKPI